MKRLVILLVSVLALGACSKSSSSETAAASTKTEKNTSSARFVNLHTGADPEYLDAGLISETSGGAIALALYDGLVEYADKGSGDPVPSLATHWDLSKDQKTWTFHLRKDAKWSDGTPLTAHDFVYSWRRVLDPATASKYAFALYYLENGAAFNQGELKDVNKVGVKAIDDYTLQATLENPTPYFLHLAAYPAYRPVPRWAIEKHGPKWTRPENFVGSGPFIMKDWIAQQRVTVVKNPYFWDAENVKAPGITFHSIEEQNTAVRMYEAGELDFVDSLPNKQIPELKKHPHYVQSPHLATYYYMFNTGKAPFDNKLVRQALSYAIDRKLLTDKYMHGTKYASSNIVADGIEGYDYPQGNDFDPAKARTLLAEAGYPNGVGFPTDATIYYNTLESHRMIAQVIQQMWKEHLGI